MNSKPDVVRFLGNGLPVNREESWRVMAIFLGHWHLKGYGMWAVEEKASGRFAGRIGYLQPEGWPDFELGWTLDSDFHGRGYATEGARAALAHAFEVLGRSHVVSLIAPQNIPSIRVAERLGERLHDRIEFRGKPVLVYRLDRATWAAGC